MEMEGKSNGPDVARERGDAPKEGEGVIKKQSFTRWLEVLDCPNPHITPLLQALALLERKIEVGGEGAQEGQGAVSKKHAMVIMGMDLLDCPVCSTPLSSPIFQCSLGHFVCSACCDKLLGTERTCGVCSGPVSNRCHGMESIIRSVLVPCSYYAHGCTSVIAYNQKAEHEKACLHAPCFCPEKGCNFAGTTAALLDHFTTQHKWPSMDFKYFEPFDVPVKAGVHILHGSSEEDDKDNDSNLFLLHIGTPDSPLNGVSLVRVQAHTPEYMIGCSVSFSWFSGQYQGVTLDMIPISSLSTGLPKCCFCIVPEVRRRGGGPVVFSVTIGLETEEDEDDNEEGDANDGHSKLEDDKKDDGADGHNGDQGK